MNYFLIYILSSYIIVPFIAGIVGDPDDSKIAAVILFSPISLLLMILLIPFGVGHFIRERF